MKAATSCGWESIAAWLLASSVTFAFAREDMKRWVLGGTM
jgi:hypothetical protein